MDKNVLRQKTSEGCEETSSSENDMIFDKRELVLCKKWLNILDTADTPAFLEQILLSLMEELQCDKGVIGSLDKHEVLHATVLSLTYNADYPVDSIQIEIPPEKWAGFMEHVLLDGRSCILNREVVLPPRHPILKNVISVPVLSGDSIEGLVILGDRNSAFNIDHVTLLKTLVRFIAPFMKLGVNASRLRERHKRETGKLVAKYDLLLSGMEKKLDELEKVNYNLKNFTRTVSHELQVPLRNISGFFRLIEKKCGAVTNDETMDYIRFASESIHRMERLLRMLMSHAEIGWRPLRHEVVELEDILDEVERDLSGIIEKERVVISRGALPAVHADRAGMVILFRNLIENAIIFSGDRTPSITVRANMNEDDGRWIVSVQDNGIGVESSKSEWIFEDFASLNHYSNYPGSGLGLAICRRIVRAHGGEIHVESTEGEGSVFSFSLPSV